MNGVEFVESFFALAKLGAVVVPLNWRLVPDELAFILQDSGATVLVYDGEFRRCVARAAASAATTRPASATGSTSATTTDARRLRALVRRAPGGGVRRRARDRRRRRRPALHHVHVGHDRPAEGRGAHPRHRRCGRASPSASTADVRYPRPLRDRAAALPRRRAHAGSPATSPRHDQRRDARLRSGAACARRSRAEQVTTLLAVPAMLQLHAAGARAGRATSTSRQLRWIMSGAAPVPVDADRGLREAGHRDPPGLRAHRELRAGVPHQPGRRASPRPARPARRSSTPTCASSTSTGDDVAPGEPAR